jgi:hypothetical protein
MENSYYLEKYAEMRHKEFVEAARMDQLIQQAKEQKPKLWQKLTWRVGDWLIGLGHRLKHERILPSEP